MTLTLSSKLYITKLSDEVQGDGYPFEAIILSGEPIEEWYRFVIDLSSMKYHKTRLTVNYNHNDELIIGYGENFQVTPEGLKSTGKLSAGSFADEIVKLAKQGVPFEASVEIDLCNAVETRVGADASTVVNGRTYQGPISVYSQVPLRAYAICPCGADKYTTLTLLTKEVNFMKKTVNTKTKFSADNDQHAPPSTDMTPAVKSQELADLCAIFGDTNGIKLYQDGTDVNEVRQWQSLNDKYAKYLSSDEDEPKQDEPPKDDEPAKDDEPKEDPPADSDPPKKDDSEPKKDDDKDDEKLSAALAKFTDKLVKKIDTEITKLKAVIPRGAEPVSHGNETLPAEPKKNSVSAAADRYKKRGVKETQ